MAAPWFATWFDSEYYHLLYGNRDYTEADAFVAKLFTTGILNPTDHVLELACGKGRHAIAMHKHGAQVMGVDLSANSIAEAKTHETDGLSFAVHDMRLPLFVNKRFDAVTNLFTSFGYFEDRSENAQVLQNVANALKHKGTFVLDFMNAAKVVQDLAGGMHHHVQRGNVGFKIQKRVEHGIIIKDISVDDPGKPSQKFQERVQALTFKDMSRLVLEAGFRVQSVAGDYHLRPFDEHTSTRCILIAEKN